MDADALFWGLVAIAAPIALERIDALLRRLLTGRDVEFISGELVDGGLGWTAQAITEARQMAKDGKIDDREADEISDLILNLGHRMLAKRLGK